MFNSDIFSTWGVILAGASFFALLFALVGMLSELVLVGVMRLSTHSISLCLLAFTGYLGVAAAIRMRNSSER